MATAKWGTLGSLNSNFIGTTIDSLADGATSAFVTYDNSANLDLYALLLLELASITSGTGANITLRQFPTVGGVIPDNTGSVGGGYEANEMLTVGASAKVTLFKVRLYPCSVRFCITNGAKVALASSGNSLRLAAYNESMA